MGPAVLILVTLCGDPAMFIGWGPDVGVPAFAGSMAYIEQDETANISVQKLLTNPDTIRTAWEIVPEPERKFKCGSPA